MFVISKKKVRTLGKKSIGQDMDLKIYGNLQPGLWIFILCDFHLWARSYKPILRQNTDFRRCSTPAQCSLNLSHCPQLETFFSSHPVLFIEYTPNPCVQRGGSDLLYSILLCVQKRGDWIPVSKCRGFGVYSMNKTGGRSTRRKMFMTRANAAS